MLRRLLIFIIIFSFFPYSTSKVYATGECQAIYGGGQTCTNTGSMILTKTVRDPKSGKFVAGLGVNDNKFQPGQSVTFQISLKNTSDGVAQNTVIKDIFPEYVTYLSNNANGKFDIKNTLTITVPILNPNESKTVTIQGKIAPDSKLPANQTLACVVNQATGMLGDKTSQSNIQFCIQKQTQNILYPAPKSKTTPPTGSDSLALAALIPAGLMGIFLRKLATGKNRS